MRRALARMGWRWPVAVLLASVAAACNVILDLQPPPPASGTGGGVGFGGSSTGGRTPDAAPPVCVALDGGVPDAATYSALTPVNGPGAAGAWDYFDLDSFNGGKNVTFAGGTFDGQYVYLAGRSTIVARYDTKGTGFEDAASWSTYDLKVLKISGGFEGAIFDGRFVYLIPGGVGTSHPSVVVRFDTQAPSHSLSDPKAWATFDTAGLAPNAGPDGGPATAGYFGGAFDGRYIYLAPRTNGVADGWVVRYDTLPSHADDMPDAGPDAADAGADDAGDSGDAGKPADAGKPMDAGDDAGEGDAGEDAGGSDAGGGAFDDAALWSTFDVATVNPVAVGFSGAVFDGKSVYFVPTANGAYDDQVHSGQSATLARLSVSGSFTTASSWSTFDLTKVNGLAYDFIGGGFDGRYVYFSPRAAGIVTRFDSTASQLGSLPAWSTYDLTQLLPTLDAAAIQYSGTAFDGRFVYFLPIANGYATLVRYDTLSTFTADCAWSSVDLTQIDAGGFVPENFNGAVFDGQYLYFIPGTNGLVVRFDAKTPSSMPALPGYSGSFW